MNIKTLISFFMWCTIINIVLLLISTGIVGFAPEWLYDMHGSWFSIPKETLDIIMYSYLGIFKIFIYIFNIVPLIALIIISSKKT